MNSSFSIKPIIILGYQRSGTTLLRTILGRHLHLLEHPKKPQFILEIYKGCFFAKSPLASLHYLGMTDAVEKRCTKRGTKVPPK